MWWSYGVALLGAWLLALIAGVTLGGWVHALLVCGVTALVVNEFATRRTARDG